MFTHICSRPNESKKMQFFWDVTPCCLVLTDISKGRSVFHIQGQDFCSDSLTTRYCRQRHYFR